MWQKPDDGTFFDLETRIVKHMQFHQHVNDQVLAIMTETCDKAIRANNVVLSPAERSRLLKKAMQRLLGQLLSEQK